MHTIWKGSISFGLVHIPIKLFSATDDKDVKLRMLHKACHTPVKYEKKCPACETKLEQQEITKGYEYDEGRFVLVEDDDFEKLNEAQTRSIDIIDFIKLEEIDPIYYNRSYFLGPQEHGEKAFSLLKQAMDDSGRIGLATFTFRSKQHLAAVRVYQQALVLETLFYPDEVRESAHVPGTQVSVNMSEKELNMAIQLIDQLTTPFNPQKYTDDYRVALMELIEGKIKGEDVKIAKEVPQTNIVHLMEALQASIDQTKPKAKSRRKKAANP
jgi:DNA end-binding protein Ku